MRISIIDYEKGRQEILDDMVYKNEELYDFIEKYNLPCLELGLLVHIYDYMCNIKGEGHDSSLMMVSSTFENAKKLRKVHMNDPDDDIEESQTDEAVLLRVFNDKEKKGYIRLDLDYMVILDGISSGDIHRLFPSNDKIIAAHTPQQRQIPIAQGIQAHVDNSSEISDIPADVQAVIPMLTKLSDSDYEYLLDLLTQVKNTHISNKKPT